MKKLNKHKEYSKWRNDADYLKKLSKEEKDWYLKFSDEYYNNTMKHNIHTDNKHYCNLKHKEYIKNDTGNYKKKYEKELKSKPSLTKKEFTKTHIKRELWNTDWHRKQCLVNKDNWDMRTTTVSHYKLASASSNLKDWEKKLIKYSKEKQLKTYCLEELELVIDYLITIQKNTFALNLDEILSESKSLLVRKEITKKRFYKTVWYLFIIIKNHVKIKDDNLQSRVNTCNIVFENQIYNKALINKKIEDEFKDLEWVINEKKN